MQRLEWELPLTTLQLVAASVAVGLVVAFVAARRMRRAGGRPATSFLAAVLRGGAVALLLLAAAGPFVAESQERHGDALLARPAHTAVAGDPVNPTVRDVMWPGDAADAATAVEILRASRAPGTPAVLGLSTNGAGPLADHVERRHVSDALRPGDRLERVGVGDPPLPRGAQARPPPGAPAILAPLVHEAGQPLELVLDAGASPFTPGTVRVTVGAERVLVAVTADTRRIAVPPVLCDAGMQLVVAEVPGRAPAARFVEIVSAPRVLVTDTVARDSSPLVLQLLTQGLDVVHAAPQEVTPSMLAAHDVLVAGPGAAGDAFERAVEERVRDGAGLVVAGGRGPLGLERLRDGTLLAALPVSLPPRAPSPPPPVQPPEPEPAPDPDPPPPDPEAPRVTLDDGEKDARRIALLLVVDRSVSMAGPKLGMAKQAAMAATRSLAPEDRVGVIVFDDSFNWAVPFQAAGNRRSVVRRLARIQAQGGTDFYRALESGYRYLERERAGVKHVIVLTDGYTRGAVWMPLVTEAAAKGMTLSCVSIGDSADDKLLTRLKNWGHGGIHYAVDPARIPEVVTEDTSKFATGPRAVKATALIDEKIAGLPPPPPTLPPAFPKPVPPPPERVAEPEETGRTASPQIVAASPALAALPAKRWPELTHVETVLPRNDSRTPLVFTDDPTPALVTGRAGLGRVAVIPADMSSPDATELFAWVHGGAFLAQLVRSVAPPREPFTRTRMASATIDARGRTHLLVPGAAAGVLRLAPVGNAASADVLAVEVTDEQGNAMATLPTPLAPGVHAGTLETNTGIFRVACVVPAVRGENQDALGSAAADAGVTFVSSLPPAPAAPPEERGLPRALPLLALAAGLLVLESLARRFAT